ncbi:MAG: aquaporin [Planctomycetota bacterium]
MNRYLCELLGTFCLVFAGCGAIAVDASTGAITHLGVCLVFGLVVMAMIYAFGETSGAHINPAVTLAFWIAGRFKGRDVAPYILAQCAGAIAAGFLVAHLFPADTVGETLPAGGAMQSLTLELVLTTILILVILAVATGSKEQGLMAGIAVGGAVALLAVVGGPVSGASMNPARSIGPAIAYGKLNDLWIYLVGPFAAAPVAFGLARLSFGFKPAR